MNEVSKEEFFRAIAAAIQADVAMAYRRCAEYKKELDALQVECEKLRKAVRNMCNLYAVDDYYSGDLREERLNQAIDAAMQKGNQ